MRIQTASVCRIGARLRVAVLLATTSAGCNNPYEGTVKKPEGFQLDPGRPFGTPEPKPARRASARNARQIGEPTNPKLND